MFNLPLPTNIYANFCHVHYKGMSLYCVVVYAVVDH